MFQLSAQGTFQKTYGGTAEEYSYAFQITQDGGFIVAGRTFSFGTGGWEGYLLRLDGIGDTVWVRTYGNILYDEIQDVDTTSDGGFILTGHTATNDWAGDVSLIKTDASGNIMWTQIYGGAIGLSDKGYSVRQTTDGGYVISGTTETYGAGGDDVYVIKTNSSGIILWTRTIGTSGTTEAGREIQQTSDGGYIVAGYTDGLGAGFYDVYLIKLDNTGVVTWSKTYGGSSYDFVYTVQQTSDNGYILGGTTDSYGAGSWDSYLLKTDVNGVLQWSKAYGLSGEDRVQAARQTSDGGYILCGRSNSFGSGGYDATLQKTDASGNLQWTKGYGGTAEDQAWYVREVDNNSYVVCGYTYSFGAGSRDAFLMKTDTLGFVGCNESLATGVVTTSPTAVSGSGGTSGTGGVLGSTPFALRGTLTVVGTECATSPCPVTASFTPSATSICEGNTIVFTNTSVGAVSYEWMEDGTFFSNAQGPAHTFNTPGTITVQLIASDGVCYDTASVLITVSSNTSSSSTVTDCDSYFWAANSTTYTTTGTYVANLTNATGCDSTITLDLTINYSNSGTASITACDSYTWSANSMTYTSSGIYTAVLTNQEGCDSTATLDLTINTVDAGVTQTDVITLQANVAGAVYQWLDCNNGYSVLSGATGQTFIATMNGNFAVQVIENGCTDTSVCVTISNVGIIENTIWNGISLSPNPTDGKVSINGIASVDEIQQITLLDIQGRVIEVLARNTTILDLTNEAKGIYFVKIETAHEVFTLRIVRQ